jgi:zinc D-Ala-D-Ala dipeptidase
VNNAEPLIALKTSDHILIEPIWENPIDDLEGPLYQEYIKNNPSYDGLYVRQTVADMLQVAAEKLYPRYRLVVRAGHRPLSVQRTLLGMVRDEYLQEHPEATPDEALEFARTYVSDPDVKVPPHCCGAAVDVDLIEMATGELVDFGCPVNTDAPISFLETDQITIQQQASRDILHTAMNEAGFAPFQAEWWHFSYGDSEWARFYDKDTAHLYDVVSVN